MDDAGTRPLVGVVLLGDAGLGARGRARVLGIHQEAPELPRWSGPRTGIAVPAGAVALSAGCVCRAERRAGNPTQIQLSWAIFTRASEFALRAGGVGLGGVSFSPWFLENDRPDATGAPGSGAMLRCRGQTVESSSAQTVLRGTGPGRRPSGRRAPRRAAGRAPIRPRSAGRWAAWEVVTARVRHLDAEDVGGGVEGEAEAPAREAAVGGRVRGELGDDVCGARRPVGRPQVRSRSVARSRARRAPRGVGDSRTLK